MRWPAAFLALAVSVVAQADDAIETLPLKHRPGTEVIPVLRPLLGPQDALSASGNTLFLRASPETVARIRKLLPTLDRPIQGLIISLREVGVHEASAGGYSGSLRLGSGDGAHKGGVCLDAQGHRYSTRMDRSARVRTLDGQPAFIETGKLIPYYSGPLFLYAPGSVSLRDASSGFWVIPRLQGEQVGLEIMAQAARPAVRGDGSIDHQQVVTRIRARLGEWISVAGTDRSVTRQRRGGFAYRTRRDDQDHRIIQLKVDLVGDNRSNPKLAEPR